MEARGALQVPSLTVMSDGDLRVIVGGLERKREEERRNGGRDISKLADTRVHVTKLRRDL